MPCTLLTTWSSLILKWVCCMGGKGFERRMACSVVVAIAA